VKTRSKQPKGPKILIVEDEPDIGTLLEHVFEREGFRAEVVRNGADAIASAQAETPSLVLLDLMLPDMSGLEILKHFKKSEFAEDVRFIIVTAKKDEIDRVLGFELGADDYVVKPFSPRELVLRVRAVLQRSDHDANGNGRDVVSVVRVGPIEIDQDGHRAVVAGRPIRLTLTEFRLLADLVRAGGRVRTREALLAEVWGYDSEVMSRTVDTHVRRLRNKLGPASSWITTVRGVGYRVQNPDETL
jgi:two-component system phosphate regulon response regulator PhoB